MDAEKPMSNKHLGEEAVVLMEKILPVCNLLMMLPMLMGSPDTEFIFLYGIFFIVVNVSMSKFGVRRRGENKHLAEIIKAVANISIILAAPMILTTPTGFWLLSILTIFRASLVFPERKIRGIICSTYCLFIPLVMFFTNHTILDAVTAFVCLTSVSLLSVSITEYFHKFIGVINMTREQLVESSKLAALGEMSGGVAHEINNPLAIIKGNSDKLQKLCTKPDLSREEITKASKRITDTSVRISKIVKSLRTIACDGANQPFTKTKIKTLVEDTLSLCQEKFKSHGVEIALPSELELEQELDCRSTEICQVILNLLNNAFDAISHQDEKKISIAVHKTNDFIAIRVADNGPGIPDHIRNKVMTPFFTTKDIGQGTGIGLSISKSIVESHGGKLRLLPPSNGTTFVIELPKLQSEMIRKSA